MKGTYPVRGAKNEKPPPVRRPPTPTGETRPPAVAKPYFSRVLYTSPHLLPGPISTVVLSNETLIWLRFFRSIVTPDAIFAAPAQGVCLLQILVHLMLLRGLWGLTRQTGRQSCICLGVTCSQHLARKQPEPRHPFWWARLYKPDEPPTPVAYSTKRAACHTQTRLDTRPGRLENPTRRRTIFGSGLGRHRSHLTNANIVTHT